MIPQLVVPGTEPWSSLISRTAGGGGFLEQEVCISLSLLLSKGNS